MRRYILIAIVLCLKINSISAQTIVQNSGWLAFTNSTKFNEKWGMTIDIQLRSSDNWEYVKNVLVRPGVTYFINAKNNVTAGYLNSTTFNRFKGFATNTQTEHRIW